MSEWIDLLKNLGATALALFALGYFVLKHLWPDHKEQIKANRELLVEELRKAREEKAKDIDRFLAELARRDDHAERVVKHLGELTEEIRQDRARRGG